MFKCSKCARKDFLTKASLARHRAKFHTGRSKRGYRTSRDPGEKFRVIVLSPENSEVVWEVDAEFPGETANQVRARLEREQRSKGSDWLIEDVRPMRPRTRKR